MPPTPHFDYQLEAFDPAPDEELICSICRCVFFDPVESPCRHVFCKKCIMQWLANHKNCPACRKRVSKSSLQDVVPIIKNMIMKLTLHCRNSQNGCRVKCTIELYESHLKSCGHEMVECENSRCGVKILRMNKENHETMLCPFRSVQCDVCKLSVLFSSRESHNCVWELLSIVQENKEKITELQQENEMLKQEIETYKMGAQQKSKASTHSSSDSSNFGSLSSITASSSSNYEDSDLEDYNVRIFSVVHPTDSFSMTASVISETQNANSSVQDISRTEDIPMDSMSNHSDNSQKSSSTDFLEQDVFSPILHSSSTSTAENSGILITESFSLSPRRSLKRRMSNSAECAAVFNQSTRSSPPFSPTYDNFWGSRRSRMAYSDTESPRIISASPDASGSRDFTEYSREHSVDVAHETIDILDSSAEDANSSNVYAGAGYAVSESSQGSNPSLRAYALGSGTSSFQERWRSKLLRQRGFKGLCGKSQLIDKNSASDVPHSRIPVPVANPGSSSAAVLPEQRMPYHSVRDRNSSPEISKGRSSNHLAFSSGLKKTLALLTKYAGKESDPDWVPSSDCHEESDSNSTTTTTSSKDNSPRLGEDLNFFSPNCEQGRQSDTNNSSSSNSESWTTDISETDSSYEVEVPPSAWDLIQRYCEDDSENDSEWIPSSNSVTH